MFNGFRDKVQGAQHELFLVEQNLTEIIQKHGIARRENQGGFGGIKMESFTADFGLPLKAGEIEISAGGQQSVASAGQNTFYGLGKDKLMVKRYVATPVFNAKYNTDPQWRLD